MDEKEKIDIRMKEIEVLMLASDFWSDKVKAQSLIKELSELKDAKEGVGKYDRNPAILSIYSGAGGDDAEDFSRILYEMYRKFVQTRGWEAHELHRHENDHGGFRNIVIEINGKGVYGILKNETGVHRLVRVSPFNAKDQRHTSFALVEFVPKLEKVAEVAIPEEEIEVQFAKSSGPGGQNVNKRETAVRVTHKPTNISVHVESERSQAQNREKALDILKGKLYRLHEQQRKKELAGLSTTSSVSIEWGNQIRSYVLHPYKLVKDHRTNVETHDVESVLEGNLEEFIDAEKGLE